MVKLSRKNSFDESDEEDPMAGVANLVDAMLVIAVGLLVFLVISWNMQATMKMSLPSRGRMQSMP